MTDIIAIIGNGVGKAAVEILFKDGKEFGIIVVDDVKTQIAVKEHILPITPVMIKATTATISDNLSPSEWYYKHHKRGKRR